MPNETTAAIALGGNLGDAPATLLEAIAALRARSDVHIVAISPLYRSLAVGPGQQPDYANAVLLIRTSLPALALLDCLQALEQQAGRVRLLHWGARTLDLDILLYGHEPIQCARLTVPHEHMLKRHFVLQPLADIVASDLSIHGQTLATWLAALGTSDLQCWPDPRWRAHTSHANPTSAT